MMERRPEGTGNKVWDRHPWLFALAVTLLALVAVVSLQLSAGASSAIVYQSF